MWKTLTDLLPKAAGKYNFAKTLKAIEICQEFRNFSKKHLPENAIKNAYPKSYKNQILTIGVLTSGWAEQIQMNKHRIHQSLQEKFGTQAVKKIKIEICEKMPGNLS